MQFVQLIAARADTGAVLPYAQVAVFLSGTTTLATLADVNGAPISNPMSALQTGAFGFAAANALYDLAISSADGSYSLPLIQKLQLADLVGLIGTITSGRLGAQTWAELSANTSAANGVLAEISPVTDTGTHTDPVVGGTVANNGVFRKEAGGWHRLYDFAPSPAVNGDYDAGSSNSRFVTPAGLTYMGLTAGLVAGQASFAPFTELPAVLGSTARVPKLTESSANAVHRAYQAIAVTSGATYSVRVIAKAAGRSILNLFAQSQLVIDADFDLSAGTATGYSSTTASIKALGNGWFECIASKAATATGSPNVQLRSSAVARDGATYQGDGTSGLLIAGASIANAAAPTTEVVASPFITDTSWIKDGTATANIVNTNPSLAATVATNATAVDGLNNGVYPVVLTESNANADHRIYRSVNAVTGRTYRIWAIVKANGRTTLGIYSQAPLPLTTVTFDVSAGLASGTGASIVPLGNGEYLCQATVVATSTAAVNVQLRLVSNGPYQGDGVSGLYISALGVDENGAAMFAPDPTGILGASWIKDGVTATLSASLRFWSPERRLEWLLQNGSANPYAGKKWCALGDSQTAYGFYTAALATLSGMTLTNVGVAGTTLSSGGTNGTAGIYNQVPNIPTNTDIVTIHGGINDHLYNVPIGARGDTTTATLYGALYAISRAINAAVPNARMFFASPCAGAGSGINASGRNAASANGIGLYVRDYQNAMKDFCEWQDIPFTNIGQTVGINEFNGNRVLSDGLHYNTIGGQMVGQCWWDDLLTKARRGVLL